MDNRHCADCGMLCHREAEFHPYLFCRLKKDDPRRDPWTDFKDAAEAFGITGLPRHPPLVRDLPLRRVQP